MVTLKTLARWWWLFGLLVVGHVLVYNIAPRQIQAGITIAYCFVYAFVIRLLLDDASDTDDQP